jgi:hypothetical protein
MLDRGSVQVPAVLADAYNQYRKMHASHTAKARTRKRVLVCFVQAYCYFVTYTVISFH